MIAEENILAVTASAEWCRAYPGAHIGLLEVAGVDNTLSPAVLEDHKRSVEERLREKYSSFTRADFLALPVMTAYALYYRRFSKTFHVLLQLESIVHKGKPLPDVSPLVDANFSAEVETHILTASHDAVCLREPVVMDIARAGEQFNRPGGGFKDLLAGDMVMRDTGGVCCSIIYGQDNRSLITPATTHALYVAYAPEGVPAERVMEHLEKVESTIRLFCPTAQTHQCRLLDA
jgi:DNA/RNA-binding domain of Phe-tRNA-synthetase-like protein